MAGKPMIGKEILDGITFFEILPTLSLKEVMSAEYRRSTNGKWEPLVNCEDLQKKLYMCKVCRVCQYGDKNLFSHLHGKKHCFQMETVKQVQLTMEIEPPKPGALQTSNVAKTIAKTPGPPKPGVLQTSSVAKTIAKTPGPPKPGVLQTSSVAKTIAKPPGPPKPGVLQTSNVPKTIAKTPNIVKNTAVIKKKAVEVKAAGGIKKVVEVNVAGGIKKAVEVKAAGGIQKAAGGIKEKPVEVKSAGGIQKASAVKAAGVVKEKAVKAKAAGGIKQTPTPPEVKSAGAIKPIKSEDAPIPKLIKSNEEKTTLINAKQCNVQTVTGKQTLIPESKKATEQKKVKQNILLSENIPNVSSDPAQYGKTIPIRMTTAISPNKNPTVLRKSTLNTATNNNLTIIEEKQDQIIQQPVGKVKAISNTSIKNSQNSKTPAKPNEERKIIKCVPLAKLLGSNEEESTNKDLSNDVIIIDEDVQKNADNDIPMEENIATGGEDIITQINVNRPVVNPAALSKKRAAVSRTYQPVNFSRTFDSPPTDSTKTGLIGVEYVIKVVKNLNDKSPRFECSLCELMLTETTMHNHLHGYNHRLKYCEKHFPTAVRQFKQYTSNVPEHQLYKVMTPILEKLAMAIEKHHGRQMPFKCFDYYYNKNRHDVFASAFNRRHASEMFGPAFTHIIDTKEVEFLIENQDNYRPQILASNSDACFENELASAYQEHSNDVMFGQNFISNQPNYSPNTNRLNPFADTVDDETHKRMVDNFLRDTKRVSSSQNQSAGHGRQDRPTKRGHDQSRSKSAERKRRRSSSPSANSQWNIERKSLSPLRDGDIWQAYRHMVDQKIRDLNITFEVYKADPEEHPLYNSEWEKFWKRRKDELIASGINHRSYNYQNEWIFFFKARLEELYNQDVENIKIQCRDRLCLPMSNDELSNTKYHVHTCDKESETVSPKIPESDAVTVPELETQNKIDDSPASSNVIHVLRILTALEEHLGSLGPCITEMLSKALQVDKLYPDKLNRLILTPGNCAILETAKEKFTGLVISKILSPIKERALKKAIHDTEELLKIADQIETTNPEVPAFEEPAVVLEQPLRRSTNNISSNSTLPKSTAASPTKNNDTALDNSEIAAILATSLVSQGKTTFNRAQLEEIIKVYTEIEKKKQIEANSRSVQASVGGQVEQNFAASSSFNNNQLPIQETLNSNSMFQNREQYQQMQSTMFNNAAIRENIGSNFSGPSAMNYMNNMNASSNFFPANMARDNYINNYNNIRRPMRNFVGSNSEGCNQYDKDQTGNSMMNTNQSINRNQPPFSMNNNYSMGPTNNGNGRNWNWN